MTAPTGPSHLSRATYRTLHSIKRRAAGEHLIPVSELVDAFASEWCLGRVERALLQVEVNRLELELAASGGEQHE